MKKYFLTAYVSVFFLILSGFSTLRSQASLDLETGIVFTGYNDVRIPGDQGTLFSLNKDLSASARIFYRIRAGYTIGTRHNLSLLYAPLNVKSQGIVQRDITFEGVVFPANSSLKGTYKFNSYRLTYRYDIIEKPRFEFGLGITAKIRDAKITLASSGLASEKTNVGFVPIINFMLAWKTGEKLSIVLDGDALAAPQGRAEDIQVALNYRLSEKVGLRAGYRILEGGADNDEVYNFALFNYASVGLTLFL
ncbi:MAG: hypothetical protein IQL11_05175 [Bacteroidales bacterium]|nr:hypothetical protein [Bacteroidales bacterium]